MNTVLFGFFGIACLLAIAWLFSNNRKAVDWRLVATGISLQIAFAALVLLVPGGRDAFNMLGDGFVKILGFVGAGSGFIFGSLLADRLGLGFVPVRKPGKLPARTRRASYRRGHAGNNDIGNLGLA